MLKKVIVEEKNEETNQNLLMAGVIFFRFRMQTPLPCGHMSENHVFFLPVNIHMVLHAGFLGCTVLIRLVGIFCIGRAVVSVISLSIHMYI